ncbi:hypothetical protein Pan153_51550 [Gimesia panareensis]|uniref:Uncharacterized protein n=2 Tax=Gimesia panareensis TaxID=2527978 RepID=A0A518FW09_9PLAN|nr:hypothetical protein Pan153_51550 [Gimesia panareensis]
MIEDRSCWNSSLSGNYPLELCFGSERQMKLLRLMMIALLLQPCPVCWGHGFADCGDSQSHEVEVCEAASCCCCLHTTEVAEIRQDSSHDDHHDCPCSCHASEQVFAPSAPVVPLKGITPLPGIMVNHDQNRSRSAVLHTVTKDTSQTPVTLPLRL